MDGTKLPIIILGMAWMQNRKLIFNLKTEVISIYNNYNCTYTPVEEEPTDAEQILAQIKDFAEESWILLAFLAGVLVIIIVGAIHREKLKVKCMAIKYL